MLDKMKTKWKVKFTSGAGEELWTVVEALSRADARQYVLEMSEELGWDATVISVVPNPVDNEDEWVFTGRTRRH